MQNIIPDFMNASVDYEAVLVQDAKALLRDTIPPRVEIVAALVATEKVRRNDADKGRQSPLHSGRSDRAIELLTKTLARELKGLLGPLLEAPRRFRTQAPGKDLLALDQALLSRLEALGANDKSLSNLEAVCRWQWLRHQVHPDSLWLLQNVNGNDATEETPSVSREVLKHWAVHYANAPTAEPLGINGDSVTVRAPDLNLLMLGFIIPTAERELGSKMMAALVAAVAGRPVEDEFVPYIEKVRSEAAAFAARIEHEASQVSLEKWCQQDTSDLPSDLTWSGWIRQVVLARFLWDAEVQALWDAGERRRRPKPSAAGTMRRLQQFSAGAGKKQVIEMTGVKFLAGEVGTNANEFTADSEIIQRVAERMIPSQSVLGQHLIRWLATDARSIAGEGGRVVVTGGFTGLAKAVLRTEQPNPKDIHAIQEVVRSMDRMMVPVRWDSKGWVGQSAVLRILGDWRGADDGREKQLTLALGDIFSVHHLPALRDLPAGQREEVRQVPTIPSEVVPPFVLGTKNRAGEAMLADELLRYMAEHSSDYFRGGVRVDTSTLLDFLSNSWLPPKEEYVLRLRRAWLAEPGEEGNTTGRPPLFVIVSPARWRINSEAWPEGHDFLMEGGRRSVAPRKTYERRQKRGGDDRP